jgi:hypothetical protein
MTEELSYVERYLVRKGSHGWTVWDREARGPANVAGRTMTGLTEEQARNVKDEFTKHCIAGAKGEGQMTKPARPASRPWTQADDDKLRAMVLTDATPKDIGHQLGRSVIAIRSRAQLLNIILKKVTVKRPVGLKVKGK